MKLRFLIPLLVSLALLAGCGHRSADPFGWRPSGNNTVDSLTTRLEYLYQAPVPPDSLAMPTQAFLEAIRLLEAYPPFNARRLFWEGRLLLRTGKEAEGEAKIRQAIALTDSAKYPYDWSRFRWTLADYSAMDDPVEVYRCLVNDEEAFKQADAPVLRAATLSTMAWMMADCGLYRRALEYSRMSDSIFFGLDSMAASEMMPARVSNKLAAVRAFQRIGEGEKAVGLLRKIKKEGMPLTSEVQGIVDCNLWIMAADTAAILELWHRERQHPAGLSGFAAAVLLEDKMTGGNIPVEESPSRLAEMVADGLEMEHQPDHRLFMRRVLAEWLSSEGRSLEAVKYWQGYAEETEALVMDMQQGEVAAADMARRISMLEESQQLKQTRQRERFWIAIALIVIVALVFMLVLKFRLDRSRRQTEKREEQLRRSRQAELAANLLVEERNRMIATLEQRLAHLVEEKKMNPRAAGELLSSLRVEEAAGKESEEFARIFRELAPGFESRLKQRYPGITKKSLRLAAYIAMGMDARHIARVMNIKVESVSQARWRLRQQLEISREEDMDMVLMAMLNVPIEK